MPAPHGNDDRGLRCLLILRRLQRRRGATVRELAEAFAQNQRTIRRDLATIRAAGFRLRVKVEAHARKRYRV
jgi:predicted DNA-binding transcriptional regulator YafY